MAILTENLTAFDPVFEVYYGRPAEFIKMEKNLEVIIQKCKDFINKGKTGTFEINETREVEEVRRMFEKFFGVEEFDLTFYTSGIFYNAYTIPRSFSFLKKSKENKQLVDPKKLYISVLINIDMIALTDLTPTELMGLILHEIGHNFDASSLMFLSSVGQVIYDACDLKSLTINGAQAAGAAIGTLVQTTKFGTKLHTEISKVFTNLLEQVPELAQILSVINNVMVSLAEFLKLSQLTTIISKLINDRNGLKHIVSPKGVLAYGGEKFADSFASAYGYGEGLSSALIKIDNKKGLLIENVQEIPVLNIGYDIVSATTGLLTMLSDPHPQNAVRVQNQIEKLKRDIKDPNLTPKIKKEIQEQIDGLEKMLNSTLLDEKYMKQRGRIMTYFLNTIFAKKFKGKFDIRNILEVFKSREL